MAHLSLYRRFRPDSFDKMVRQEHVTTVLRNQIASGSVGHAYLFCGPRGTGKTSVARIFARAVNCERPVGGSPCGECAVCRALSDGNSLDIAEIDAASNNGVNEMRELREKVQYPPVDGRYKVYIIDEVHMLTDSAFNALLKTLEEPPSHVIFILATTEPHKIPATILSRCMRLDFKLIPEKDLEEHLKRVLAEVGKPFEDEAVAAIARAGAGSDRDMLSIAETCMSYGDKLTYEGVTKALGAADFAETAALCGALLRADVAAALSMTEEIVSEGKAVGVLLRDVLQMLNRIAVAKNCRNAEQLLSLPETNYRTVEKIASEADGRAILRASEILAKAEADLRFVSSPRIRFETAVMKIAMPAADVGGDALLVRLNLLEKRVTEGMPAANSVFAPAAAPSPTETAEKSAEKPAPVVKETEPAAEDPFAFPLEEPVFPEAYFSDGTPAGTETVRPDRGQPERTESVREKTPAPGQTPSAVPEMTAELAFGKFIRLLRKTSRNGVLFTMCSDLEAVFEGETLVLYTDNATICRSLKREDHLSVMADVFSRLGIDSFDVRMKGAETQTGEKDAIAQIRRDFKDYPVEIK